MGELNAVPMRINKVEGAAGQVKISGGPGVLESWGVAGAAGGDAVITIAANNTPAAQRARADFVCGGANDDAIIEAQVAAGVTIKLMVGNYIFNNPLDILVSNFRLEGSGKGTVISGVIASDYIKVGNNATHIENVTICDLAIDGTSQTAGHGIFLDGGSAANRIENCRVANCLVENCDDDGISGEYVYYSVVTDNMCQSNGSEGIYIDESTGNTIVDNVCYNNGAEGIEIESSTNIAVTSNTCCSNNGGIKLKISDYNSVAGNTCSDNTTIGIQLADSTYNSVTGNTCSNNDPGGINYYGISIYQSDYNVITGNNCEANGGYNIYLWRSSHNTVSGNVGNNSNSGCGLDIKGDATGDANYNIVSGNNFYNNAIYGISISGVSAYCNHNRVINNKLTGNGTAPFLDNSGVTMLATYVVPFSDGSTPLDGGYEIDAADEFARAWARLPVEVQQVMCMRIYARSVIAELHGMCLEIIVNGGADNEAYNTHATAIATAISTTTNFAADDIIHWRRVEATILALVGGDSIEIKVLYEPADNDDIATDAYFRTVEFEYV